MEDRASVAVIGAALTGLLAVVVSLPPWPNALAEFVLVSIGSHGVHVGDLPAVSLWVVGVTACFHRWTSLGTQSGP